MACIVNMGTVFQLVRNLSISRGLVPQAKDWLARRFPAEISIRDDWTTKVAEPRPGGWEWVIGLSQSDQSAMQTVIAAAERHVTKAVANDEPLVMFLFRFIEGDDESCNVADWLASLPTEAPAMLRKLPKVTWPQAVEHSKRWHERLAKRQAEAVSVAELAEGTQPVMRLPDGWCWLRLTTEAALDREGEVMGHCVGSGGYDNLLEAQAPDGIYSLRDGRGRPHVTVEVRNGVIRQAQGRGNTSPTGHAQRLAVLVQALGVDIGRQSPGLFGMARVCGRLIPLDAAMEMLASSPVDGDVDLREADIASLPEGLSVGGSLNLYGCTALTSLSESLFVGGSLNLNGCTALSSLPEGLFVGSWLSLHGCTSLTSRPERLSVGGAIHGAEWPVTELLFSLPANPSFSPRRRIG